MTDGDLADTTNHQIVLAKRPEGLVARDDFDFVEGTVPEPAEGEAVVRTLCLGIDATVRTWLNKGEGYLPAVEIGEVVRCSGVGRTVASRSPKFPVGGLVYGLPGWQEYSLARDDGLSTPIGTEGDPAAMLSVLGATGLTAYFGLTEVGEAKEGETVVVSAAAGATGSAVVQIAKILGCRVVGIAGTDEKCRFVVDELGFDAAINHRSDDLRAALKEHCPKGVDVYFDNVGGRVLDAVLGRLAFSGRVVLCGAISVYNDTTRPPGPANYLNLIQQRGRMEGFIAFDHWGRLDEVMGVLRGWVDDGSLRHVEHYFDGLESSVDALNALFTGANTGKVIVRL